jgi:hypothetical protein
MTEYYQKIIYGKMLIELKYHIKQHSGSAINKILFSYILLSQFLQDLEVSKNLLQFQADCQILQALFI